MGVSDFQCHAICKLWLISTPAVPPHDDDDQTRWSHHHQHAHHHFICSPYWWNCRSLRTGMRCPLLIKLHGVNDIWLLVRWPRMDWRNRLYCTLYLHSVQPVLQPMLVDIDCCEYIYWRSSHILSRALSKHQKSTSTRFDGVRFSCALHVFHIITSCFYWSVSERKDLSLGCAVRHPISMCFRSNQRPIIYALHGNHIIHLASSLSQYCTKATSEPPAF